MPNDGDQPDNRNWPGISEAVRARMNTERVSRAELARRTALPPGTLATITASGGPVPEADLVTISAVLGWHPHHLINILYRRPPGDTAFESPAERALHGGVLNRIARIEEKIDRLLTERDHPTKHDQADG